MSSKGTYTVAEAAEVLGVSDWYVRRQIKAGKLPVLPLAGRVLRLPRKPIDALANGEPLLEAQ